ncbi:MAG: N-acetyltransferase [Planctomycetales bacterium]
METASDVIATVNTRWKPSSLSISIRRLIIIIRRETPSDVPTIAALTEAAFRNAPHAGHTEHFIVDALRAAEMLSVSLVAEMNGALVGHVAISPVAVSDGADGWFGLGPISVLPERQRQGIGSQLMEHALSELNQLNASGCVVLGDPKFYARFGFQANPNLVLPEVPPEYFQTLALGAEIPRGEVTYHDAFNARE